VLNGKPVPENWLNHFDLFGRDANLEFEMTDSPVIKQDMNSKSISQK
jgi:hypothetical protein